jgi:hypothetical protein
MNVEIGEVTSTVRAVDTDTLLSPRVLERVVAAVVDALKDRDQHEKRAQAERRVTGGVSAERDEESP